MPATGYLIYSPPFLRILIERNPLVMLDSPNSTIHSCTKGRRQMHVSFPVLLAALSDWLYYGVLGLGVIGLVGLLIYLRKKQGGEED
jgi:hypothetical protein